MLSGVSIICFVGSYAVALALELSRLIFRSGLRRAAMLAFVVAGLVAHTAFLYHQAVATPGSPLSSPRDWYLLAAWLLAAIYLYLACYHPKNAFGVFLLPLVLVLIGVAVFVADAAPFAREPASRAWGLVHGASILLVCVSLLVGMMAGAMYLEQTRRLKRKLPPVRGLRLPSLEWLARANSRAVVVSTMMLGVGLASGEILRALGREGRVPWYDPVVLSTLGMFCCLLAASIVAAVYRPVSAGRKVAYLTLVSTVVLVVGLSMVLSVGTEHGGRRTPSSDVQPPPTRDAA